MDLIPSFYQDLMLIPWFAECGRIGSLPQDVQSAQSLEEALISLNSPLWVDVRTEAQGDLTGYLAKHHYTIYGVSWNNLAKESRSRLEKDIRPLLQSALEAAGMPDITKDVLLDIIKQIDVHLEDKPDRVSINKLCWKRLFGRMVESVKKR